MANEDSLSLLLQIQLQIVQQGRRERELGYPSFSGADYEDGLEWLLKYNRVAEFNQTSDDDKLKRVGLSFTGDALKWYERAVRVWRSWADCEAAFEDRFIDRVALGRSNSSRRSQRTTRPNSYHTWST